MGYNITCLLQAVCLCRQYARRKCAARGFALGWHWGVAIFKSWPGQASHATSMSLSFPTYSVRRLGLMTCQLYHCEPLSLSGRSCILCFCPAQWLHSHCVSAEVWCFISGSNLNGGVSRSNSNLNFTTYWLCSLGHVTYPLTFQFLIDTTTLVFFTSVLPELNKSSYVKCQVYGG